MLAHGINFANVEYTLAPGKRMPEICQEIRRATDWLLDNLAQLGGGGGLDDLLPNFARCGGPVFDVEPVELLRLLPVPADKGLGVGERRDAGRVHHQAVQDGAQDR